LKCHPKDLKLFIPKFDVMGLLDILKGLFGKNEKPWYASKKYKCPNCGYFPITLDMKRCPKCGVRIGSMFKKKCPKCKTNNDLDAKVCIKCGYNFDEAEGKSKKTIYKCPNCGYEADYLFDVCPVCGTRMV